MKLFLDHDDQEDLLRAFVVVEPGRHRFRRLPPPPSRQD